MSGEESIFQEISEELKSDQLFVFIGKYKNAIIAVIFAVVVGILAYSSWHLRKNNQMEEITNAIIEVLQSPTSKNTLLLDKLINTAPAELKPILIIIRSGGKLFSCEDMLENADALLTLSQKQGVDIVWKDLATIIYASYGLKPVDELIKLLEPLSGESRPFRFSAMKYIATNYESRGDHDKAQEYLKKIIDNNEAPKTLKKRALITLNYIRNNSEKR